MPRISEKNHNDRRRDRVLTKVKTGKGRLHPITGCRMDTLMGLWFMDAQLLEQCRNQISAYDLQTLKEMSAQIEAPVSRTIVQGAEGTHKSIARIDITGMTTKYSTSFQAISGGTSTMLVRRLLIKAANDPEIAAILLAHDSPGGTAHGAFDFADVIAKIAARKPIIAFGHGMMTSGAALSSSQCNYIIATPETSLGSIGVKAVLRDTSEAAAKMGIRVIEVTAGKYKSVGEPGTPITKEQIAYIKDSVEQTHAMFLSYVSRGRGIETQKLDDLQAKMFLADEGKRHGLIDEVGDEDRAVAVAVEAAQDPARFLSRKSTPVGALTTAPSTVADSTDRSKRIMLTPEQLAQAKQLPGAKSTLTAENADTELFSVASTLATENKQLKDAAVGPAKLPDNLIQQYVGSAHERVDILRDREKLSPGQADMLKGFITKDVVGADGAIKLSLDQVGKIIGENRPAGLVEANGAETGKGKELSGVQAQQRHTPDAPDKEKPMTPDEVKHTMATHFSGLGARSN